MENFPLEFDIFYEKMLENCNKMAKGWFENAVLRGNFRLMKKNLWEIGVVMEKLAYLIGFYGNFKDFKLNWRCKRYVSGFFIN